jgi:hypothetical protein
MFSIDVRFNNGVSVTFSNLNVADIQALVGIVCSGKMLMVDGKFLAVNVFVYPFAAPAKSEKI